MTLFVFWQSILVKTILMSVKRHKPVSWAYHKVLKQGLTAILAQSEGNYTHLQTKGGAKSGLQQSTNNGFFAEYEFLTNILKCICLQ